MTTTELLTTARRLVLANPCHPLAEVVSELDLRLAAGDRLPEDWRCADRRAGADRRAARADALG